jgi:hypothetical protein
MAEFKFTESSNHTQIYFSHRLVNFFLLGPPLKYRWMYGSDGAYSHIYVAGKD